jgi:hypothetical protein
MSEIQGGIDHQLTATAPISGGGGLADIAVRSYGITASLAQLMSPLIISIPATDRMPDSRGNKKTNCAMDERSIRILVEDGASVPEIELACLKPQQDNLGMTVVVQNLTTKERRCARTQDSGRFRVPLAASTGDRLDVLIYDKPDAVDDYKSCVPNEGANVVREINTFEQPDPQNVAGKSSCPMDASGCAQFMSHFYPVQSPLVAVQEGLGYARNTPDYRKLVGLIQAVLDPADPINYAPYYLARPRTGGEATVLQEPLLAPDGKVAPARGLLSVNTVGDGFVSISTGVAFARAAGIVTFFPPSAIDLYPEYRDWVTPQALYEQQGGRTANRALIEANLVEGIARLARHPAGPNCSVNYKRDDPVACPSNPQPDPITCQNTLFDVDWLSEGTQPFDAQHPISPLRLARRAGMRVVDAITLARAWEPRIAGKPLLTDDANAWKADGQIVGMINVYIEPGGKHAWETGDACKIWDDATYGGNMVGHFFASGGKDPYYLSHPATHLCLERKDCSFYK